LSDLGLFWTTFIFAAFPVTLFVTFRPKDAKGLIAIDLSKNAAARIVYYVRKPLCRIVCSVEKGPFKICAKNNISDAPLLCPHFGFFFKFMYTAHYFMYFYRDPLSQSPILNFAPRGELGPQGGTLSPDGGEIICMPLGSSKQ
jgi:hypothetical protein